MALPDDKERVTVVLEKKFIAELDAFADEHKTSRSALLAGFIELGYKQTLTTKKLFANKFVVKALHLIFGDGIPRQARLEGEAAVLSNPAAETLRQDIIRKIEELSVAQAEAEIRRDLGIEETQAVKPATA